MTRMKDIADFVVVENRPVPAGKNVRSDQVISLFQHAQEGNDLFFRRIVVWDEQNQRELVFLTNHLSLPPPPWPPSTRTAGKWSCSSSRSASGEAWVRWIFQRNPAGHEGAAEIKSGDNDYPA